MRGNKTAVWRNGTGQEIVFDNRTCFLEDIDMTGTSGIHTVESLARADGQVSITHQLAAKTIPCSFAWYDSTQEDDYMREKLTQLFNPLMSGTLTVYTRENVYAIDCYPQDFPVFKRVSGLPVWRWNVDFVADYPYWRKGTERHAELSELPVDNLGRHYLMSSCPFAIAPNIYLPASAYYNWFAISGKGMTIHNHENNAIIIKAGTLEVVNADTGENCNYLIDAQYAIESLRINYGKNRVVYGGSANGVLLSYYNLSMGEV